MCGGRGTRLDADVEKPLYRVAGEPMVDRVLAALDASRVDAAVPVVSPHVPETATHLRDARARDPVETPGEGYVADLGAALDDPRVERPVLTVVADLPLLAGEVIDRALDAYDGRDLTACVPAVLKDAVGVSADRTRAHGGSDLAPAGLNVVAPDDAFDGEPRCEGGADERLHVSYDARLAVNVNYPDDAAVAEVLARGP